MSTRSVIALVVVTAALSALFSFSVAAGGLHRGPVGDAGPAGPAGPPGPAGRAEVDAADVQRAIEDDPARVADALREELDVQDPSTGTGTTDTGDVEREVSDLRDTVEDLRRKLDDLCADLSGTSAGRDLTSC